MGMWRAGMDGTDINSCCRTPDADGNNSADPPPGGALLASADDSGTIHLLNYPCVVADAPSKQFRGHASHVCGASPTQSLPRTRCPRLRV